MPEFFTIAVFLIGLVSGSGLTLCIAALAGMRDPNDHQADQEYL